MGRLVNQDDCNMCLRIIMNSIDALNEHLDADAVAKSQQTFICAKEGVNPAAIRTVRPGAELTHVIMQRIDVSQPTVACTGSAPTIEDLSAWSTLYGDVLTKVTVALHHPRGHIHLAGPGGSGKYTVAKAAARLCGLQIVDLNVSHGEAALLQQLCTVFWDSGVGKVDQALLLPSHVNATSEVLGLLSDVLAPSGYAQMIALFSPARQNDVYAAIRGDVRKQGMEDSRENCWVLFNAQVHKHLRIVATSATNDLANWGSRAMSYPLLITRMTVVWIGALLPDKTHDFGIPYLGSLLDHDLQEERPELVSQVSRHLTLVHQAAADFLSRPQPPDPLPPLSAYPSTSFTWYAQTWTSIYKRMRDDVKEKSRRAVIAAEKLDAELTRLSDLEAAIEDQKQVVEQKKIVANRLLANVGQETAMLNEQKAILEEDSNAEKKAGAIVAAIEADIQTHMDEQIPFSEVASGALERVESPAVLNEIRGFTTPSDSVLVTMRSLLIILIPKGKAMPLPEALAWKEVRKLLTKPDAFVTQLIKYDVRNTSPAAVELIEKSYMNTPAFETADKEGAKETATTEALKAWIAATIQLFHIQQTLIPKQAILEDQIKAHDTTVAKYQDLLTRVRNLEARLADVMSSFQDATEEKNAAIVRLEELTASYGIARKLAVCLEGGRANRLQEAKERYALETDCLLGDSLTAAAFVSFAGALGPVCRDSFIRYQVLADLRAQKVQVSSGTVLSLFASPSTAADWKSMGLPDDPYCVEGASIALYSTAWPLLVDPEGVGLRWVTALYERQGVKVTVVSNQSDNLIPLLRSCVINGTPMVITGPLGGLNADIMAIAARRFYMHQRTVVVDLGAEVLEVSTSFRLFFATGLGRVDFALELSFLASVVSFTASEEAVRQRTLWSVVRNEAPRVFDALTGMQEKIRKLLGDKENLEAAMLKALSEEEGMVLSDGLAARLSEDLGSADALDLALQESTEELTTAQDIMRLYEPVSRRGALLMQVATRLIQVSPTCAFSAPALREAIEQGIENSARKVDDKILEKLLNYQKEAAVEKIEGETEAETEADAEARAEAAKEREKGLAVVRAGAMRCMRGVTERVAEVVGAAMESKDRNVFSALVAIAVFMDSVPDDKILQKQEVIDLYLSMPNAKTHSNKGTASTSPFPSWLPDSSHAAISHFAKIKRGSPLHDVGTNLRDAKALCEAAEPEHIPPNEWPAWGLDELERWAALCALRPDRAVHAAHVFASSVCAGRLPLEPPPLSTAITGHAANRPLLIMLPHSSDLFDMQRSIVQSLGNKSVFERAIVDGTNDDHVSAAVDKAMAEGKTILVHSPELSVSWQRSYLDPLLDRLGAPKDSASEVAPPAPGTPNRGADTPTRSIAKKTPSAGSAGATAASAAPVMPKNGFRLVLVVVVSGSSLDLSRDTLACCTKIRLEAPLAMKNFQDRSADALSKMVPATQASAYKKLVTQLSLLHASMRNRALFGPVGLSATGLSGEGGVVYALKVCMDAAPSIKQDDVLTQNWSAWASIVQATWMGPFLEKGADFRVMQGILSQLISDEVVKEDGGVVPLEKRLGVSGWAEQNRVIGDGFQLQREIGQVMMVRRKREISRMDKAKMSLDEIQERLPRTMPNPQLPEGAEKDLYFYFLQREVNRMRALMDQVWSCLVDIELVLEGARQLNPEQDALIQAIYNDRVPSAWASKAYPSLRPLGGWFADLVLRSDVLSEWQRQGQLPPSVWIGGLFQPQGLVAAAIVHHATHMSWPLNEVEVHMEITRKTADEVALQGAGSAPVARKGDGVLVHGLWLEGAKWDVRLGAMEELKPSHSPGEIPVVLLRVTRVEDQATENPFGVPLKESSNSYNCPVYYTQQRGETLVFSGVLRTRHGGQAWVRAGVAMVLDPYNSV